MFSRPNGYKIERIFNLLMAVRSFTINDGKKLDVFP